MGRIRRKFTKEMKLAAIQRLETGSSAVEVARAFEFCTVGGKSSCTVLSMRFPEKGNGAGRNPRSPDRSVRWANKPWRSIF